MAVEYSTSALPDTLSFINGGLAISPDIKKMKAIVYHKYGTPDVLEFKETDKPVPDKNEVLIKVHPASINIWGWGLLHGDFTNLMLNGLRSLPCPPLAGAGLPKFLHHQIGVESKLRAALSPPLFGDSQ